MAVLEHARGKRGRYAPYVIAAALVVLALAIVWAFVATTLDYAGAIGLPSDDGYAALMSARELGRGELFDSHIASVTWPLLLAPFSLAIHGHALVAVSFGLCAALYAVVGVGVQRVARAVGGCEVPALAAAGVAVVHVPFASRVLSGTELGLAAALVAGTLLLLSRQTIDRRPSPALVVCGVLASLSRPDAMSFVAAVVVVVAARQLHRRAWRDAMSWLVLLAPAAVWVVLGTRPRLDVPALSSLPLALIALYIIGAVRILWWAWREKRLVLGVATVLAPSLPLVFVPIGVALAPLRWVRDRARWRVAWNMAVVVLAVGYSLVALRARFVADVRTFAKQVADTNAGGVALGRYVHDRLPSATVLVPGAGAIAYHADRQAILAPRDADGEGPGVRFEAFERMPAERRPTHVAVGARWKDMTELFGSVVVRKSGVDLVEARWDHAASSERPLNDHAGWAVVDRVDVADLASERAHAWIGRRGTSFVERTLSPYLAIDGGRTILQAGERFTVAIDPGKPTRVVLRAGGQRSYGTAEIIDKPVEIVLFAGAKRIGALTIPPPQGTFAEVTFNLPPHVAASGSVALHTTASGLYRSFQWFVLQPE